MGTSRIDAIRSVIVSLGLPGRRLEQILEAHSDGGPEAIKRAVAQAMAAGREAIDALPAERASRLTTAEVAVYIGLGLRRAQSLLPRFRKTPSMPPHRWNPTKDFRREKMPERRGGKLITKTSSTGEKIPARTPGITLHGNAQARNAPWLYRRESIKEWWDEREEARDRDRDARSTREHHKQEARREGHDLIDRLLASGHTIADIKDALRPLAWLLDKEGRVVDSLTLPQREPAALTQALITGHGESLSLLDVMTRRTWLDNAVREPWHTLFSEALHATANDADRRRADRAAEQLRADPARAAGKVIRNRPR